MSKTTAAQERLITNAVAIAATRLLFDALKRNFPSRLLSEIVTIHNGQGLRAIDRDERGQYDVYAAGGLVGKHSAKLTEKPFVVIGRKGSAGKPSYAPFGGWVIDTAYYAQPNNEKDLDCQFLFYAISSLDFTGDIISTAIPGINRTSIYRYSIPIPSRNIQDACVRFLNAAADKSRKNGLPELPSPLDRVREIVARIEELSAKIEEARVLRQQTVNETTAVMQSWLLTAAQRLQSRLGSLRRGLLSARNGLSRRPSGTEDGPIVLRLADLSAGFVDLANPRRGRLSATEIEMYDLTRGDLLFVRVNGSLDIVGRCIPFDGAREVVCFNDHLIRVRLNHEIFDPAYVRVMANSPLARDYMKRTAITTAGQNTINQTMLANMPIPIPALTEQRRIVAYLDNLEAKVDVLKKLQEETAKELNALLPSILSRAFSGSL